MSSTPDAPTLAALGGSVIRAPFLAYLDFLDDPVRVTTWETSLTLTGTGDSDIDGQSFTAISPQFGSVSPVKRQTGGSDTVTFTLSGIVGPDSDLLDILGDVTKWRLRLARCWFLLKNEDGSNVGGVANYITGRMIGFKVHCEATSQTAQVTVETYRASLTDASNSTYLNQSEFDGNDTSAALTIACANGAAAQQQ